MTHIAVIGGSNRAKAESHRVAEILTAKLTAAGAGADLISLRDVRLPLWDEGKWDKDADPESPWKTVWPGVSQRLKAADGFVVVSPEWHGMVAPPLKNLLACCDGGEVAFKPGLIVTVAAATGGAYPVSELRAYGAKNNFLHWLPEHIIIRNVGGYRPGDEANTAPDWLDARIDHALGLLTAFADAAKPIRETRIDWSMVKTGM